MMTRLGHVLARCLGRGGLLAAASLAAVLAVAATGGDARAQAPQATCRGQMTITPNPVFTAGVPEVTVRATGLAANASFTLTINGVEMGRGVTNADGSMNFTLVPLPITSNPAEVRVQTAETCATGELRFAVSLRANVCVPARSIDGTLFCFFRGIVPVGVTCVPVFVGGVLTCVPSNAILPVTVPVFVP
jgi:hypothetical protein